MTLRNDLFAAIENERAYQDRKHQHKHELPGYLLIMEGKLADAKAKWLGVGSEEAAEEILQLIAVGVAALEAECIVPTPQHHYGRISESHGY